MGDLSGLSACPGGRGRAPAAGGQHVPVFGLGRGVIPPLGHLQGDLVPGGQRVRVVGAEHPQLGGQHVPELGLGRGVIASGGHLHRAIWCTGGEGGRDGRGRAPATGRPARPGIRPRPQRGILVLPLAGRHARRVRCRLHRVVWTVRLRDDGCQTLRRYAGPGTAMRAKSADLRAGQSGGRCCPAPAAGRPAPRKPAARGRPAGRLVSRTSGCNRASRDRRRAGLLVSRSRSPKSSSALSACHSRDPVISRNERGRGQRVRVQQQLVGDRRVGEAGQQPQHLAGLGQRPGIEQSKVRSQVRPISPRAWSGVSCPPGARNTAPGHRRGSRPGTAGRSGSRRCP